MTFSDKNKSFYPETKQKEKSESLLNSNIKNTISEINAKNSILKEKIEIHNKNNIMSPEDEKFLDNLSNEIKETLGKLSKGINDYEKSKNPESILITSFKKKLEQENSSYKSNCSSLKSLKKTVEKSSSFDNVDSNTRLMSDNFENQENQLKFAEINIKSISDIAAYRTTRISNICNQTKMIEVITKDLKSITQNQTEKLNLFSDHVTIVSNNVKEANTELMKTFKQESAFKDNKCCLILLITFALIFITLMIINMNK
jgi:hypothetical protein